MRGVVWGLLAGLVGCGDDCDPGEPGYEVCRALQREQEEAEDPGPSGPSDEARAAAEDAIRQHASGLPMLLEVLAAPGPALLDWPGGHPIEITVAPEGTFANDAVRDGFFFAGSFVREPDGSYADGHVEIDGLGVGLRIEAWSLALPMLGRAEVSGTGLTGVLQWPGDGFAYFTGTYREPGTRAVTLQFGFPATPPG